MQIFFIISVLKPVALVKDWLVNGSGGLEVGKIIVVEFPLLFVVQIVVRDIFFERGGRGRVVTFSLLINPKHSINHY